MCKVFTNDLIAMGVWQCLTDKKLRIPEDFGLCGFDNSYAASMPQIQMTSVAQPLKEMGKYATEILLYAIALQPGLHFQEIILPTKLMVRRSTDKNHEQSFPKEKL